MRRGILIVMALLLAQGAMAARITSVNFLQEGEVSKLVLELDSPAAAERFAVQDDKQIILDVKDVKIENRLLRGIDTSEFDGATVYISGYPRPGAPQDVRFAIQLRDNVRSILDTNGNKIVLSIENRFGVFSKSRVDESKNEVRAGTTDTQGNEVVVDNVRLLVPKSNSVEDILANLVLSGPKKYVGKKISINVSEIPVKDLLKMISETSGFNIILDNDVTKVPPMTLSLTNIPWDQALDTILSLARLVATKNSNILTVKTQDQATKEREALAAAEALKLGLEPLVTKVFPISYADIASLQVIIKDYMTEKRGALQQDARTNTLIVRDTVDAIERIRKIIELLDTQTPQILIESKVIEASETYAKRIGLTNGVQFGYDPLTAKSLLDRNQGSLGGSAAFSFSPVSAFSGGTQGLNIGITAFKRLKGLNLSLEMLEQEGLARTVTAPKVITQNKKAASITSTQAQSFITSVPGPTGTTSQISSVSVNLNLSVTPQVTNEGAINLEVTLSKGSFIPTASGPPGTLQNQLRTNVLVDNGSTVVLGGLYQTSKISNSNGIPYLKDLPLVGWLFRNPFNTNETRTELLVFLTPRIINENEAGLTARGNSTSVKTE